jgi:protein-disulfide isomerase
MKNKKILFAVATIVLIGLFVLAKNFYKNNESKRLGFLAQENASLFVKDYSPQYGAEDAKVYLVEFLDPECESCREMYPQVKALLKEFEGKVKLIIRYAAFHGNSHIAIAALEASRKQGKYWEALELLFNYQPAWGDHHNPQPNLIFDYLSQIGIDIEKLKADMTDPKIEQMISQEMADLGQLNIRQTPTFFVNGKRVESFGIDYLRAAIEEEVRKTYE